MDNQYTSNTQKSSDLRRLHPDRRPGAIKLASRQICRRYGVSEAHARVIANMQRYGHA